MCRVVGARFCKFALFGRFEFWMQNESWAWQFVSLVCDFALVKFSGTAQTLV